MQWKFTHSGLLVVNQAVPSVINKWLVVLLPTGRCPDSCFVASSHWFFLHVRLYFPRPLIDILKALACALIVWHHLAFYGPMSDVAWPLFPGLFAWLYNDARMAVQVFLVLGGYLSVAHPQPQGGPVSKACNSNWDGVLRVWWCPMRWRWSWRCWRLPWSGRGWTIPACRRNLACRSCWPMPCFCRTSWGGVPVGRGLVCGHRFPVVPDGNPAVCRCSGRARSGRA